MVVGLALAFGGRKWYLLDKINPIWELNYKVAMNHQILEKTVNPKERLEEMLQKAGSSLQMKDVSVPGYERVVHVTDRSCGLNAFICIHNTVLGSALGGIRIFPYANEQDALKDGLRLAKGMTYKSAVAGVGFGGGKSVIIADPKTQKTPELLKAFGRAVERFEGIYICAEDVGCTTADVRVIRQETCYVVGLPHEKSSGDPGPFTAWGTFRSMQATAKHLWGSDSLEGKKVAIQGLGNVGRNLIDFLFWAGAELIVADLDKEAVERAARRYGAQVVSVAEIAKVPCDIFSPCALGAVINDQTIPHFRCKAIVGSANNQLLSDSHAEDLRVRGILYAPDFVTNAGGLLNVAMELEEQGYSSKVSRNKVTHIYDTLKAIYEISEKNKESTHEAAVSLAEYRMKYGIGKRLNSPTFHHTAE